MVSSLDLSAFVSFTVLNPFFPLSGIILQGLVIHFRFPFLSLKALSKLLLFI